MRIDGLWSKFLDMTTEPDVRLDVTQIVVFWVTEAEEALEVADHLVAKAD